MSNETTVTVAGNLAADPELRFTGSGVPVAHFTVTSTGCAPDRASGGWRDVDMLFLRCTAWRRAAQNAIESLRKGTRVVVIGRLQQHTYETDDGEKRSTIELVADEVSVSLRHATVHAVPSRAPTEMGSPATDRPEPSRRQTP